MSLVGSRVSMRDRCLIERAATSTGSWNVPGPPTWSAHVSGVPCRVFAKDGRERTDAETNVVVEDMRLLVPLGTDVTASDRVGLVTRRGATVVAGPVGIRAVLPRATHLELVLVALS